jgi:LysM domain
MTASTQSSSRRAARSKDAAPRQVRPARPVACIRSFPAPSVLVPPMAPPMPGRQAVPRERPQAAGPPMLLFGRMARWVVAVATVTLIVVGGMNWMGSAANPGSPVETTVTHVGAGETVWDVARRMAPQSDQRVMVDRIRQLNGIVGSAVQPGQQLQVPVSSSCC